MTALRITLVTESFYPQVDETTPTVRHTAHELIRLGHRVQLIAPAPGLTSYRHHEVARIRSGGRGAQIRAALDPLLDQALFPGGDKAGWWLKCVQLDLEAKGILKRAPGSPVRLSKVST